MNQPSFGIPIGELSRRTACNIETIRYYERIGVLPVPMEGRRALGCRTRARPGRRERLARVRCGSGCGLSAGMREARAR